MWWNRENPPQASQTSWDGIQPWQFRNPNAKDPQPTIKHSARIGFSGGIVLKGIAPRLTDTNERQASNLLAKLFNLLNL